MVRRRRPPQWHLAFTGLVLLVALAAAVYLGGISAVDEAQVEAAPPAAPARLTHAGSNAFADSLYAQVDSALGELGIQPAQVSKRRSAAGPPADVIDVRVPRDLPVASVNLQLTRFVEGQGGHVVRGVEIDGPDAVDLTCGLDSAVTTLFRLRADGGVARRTGRIAVVVRDAGRGRMREFLALPQPLTFAGLRDAADSTDERAAAAGHEIAGDGVPQMQAAMPLDATDDEGEIERQLWSLAELAASYGSAVGVARGSQGTLQALRAVAPRLELRGYRFVRLSELRQ